MPPRVSVVIPAYNNADYLADTIDSVLAQTFMDFELIIADHSSADGTWQIMERYSGEPRVRLLQTPTGGGAPRNWNRVSQEATGEYLKLVCGDDLLRPTIIERQVAALEANPGTVAAASPRAIIDANNQPIIASRGLTGLAGRHSGASAVARTVRAGTNLFGEPACVLLRRDALEAVGWWDARWPYLIDQATYSRVLLTGDFVGVGGEALAAFRISDSQWSVRLARQQSEQAAGLHRWLHEEHPDAVSAVDVRLGNVRALRTSLLRRAAYIYLARRMSRGGSLPG